MPNQETIIEFPPSTNLTVQRSMFSNLMSLDTNTSASSGPPPITIRSPVFDIELNYNERNRFIYLFHLLRIVMAEKILVDSGMRIIRDYG